MLDLAFLEAEARAAGHICATDAYALIRENAALRAVMVAARKCCLVRLEINDLICDALADFDALYPKKEGK